MNHTSDNCIFCKIVAGDIPSIKVYEDDDVLAFLDISQVTKGHTLLVPKLHSENIFELKSETAAKLFEKAPYIANALKMAFSPEGLNVVNNNGESAGQTVFHYHMHFIPRYGKGDGFGAVWKSNQSQYTPEKLIGLQQEIKKFL